MATNLSRCMSPLTAEQQQSFNSMLQGMQERMADVRMQSARMAYEAERSSSMAFLNC